MRDDDVVLEAVCVVEMVEADVSSSSSSSSSSAEELPVARPVEVASGLSRSASEVVSLELVELRPEERDYAQRLVPTQMFFGAEALLLAYAPTAAPTDLLAGLSIIFFLAPATAFMAFMYRPYDKGLVDFHVRMNFGKAFFFACFALLGPPRAVGLLFLVTSLISAYLSFRLFALLKIIGDDEDRIKDLVSDPRFQAEVWNFFTSFRRDLA